MSTWSSTITFLNSSETSTLFASNMSMIMSARGANQRTTSRKLYERSSCFFPASTPGVSTSVAPREKFDGTSHPEKRWRNELPNWLSS